MARGWHGDGTNGHGFERKRALVQAADRARTCAWATGHAAGVGQDKRGARWCCCQGSVPGGAPELLRAEHPHAARAAHPSHPGRVVPQAPEHAAPGLGRQPRQGRDVEPAARGREVARGPGGVGVEARLFLQARRNRRGGKHIHAVAQETFLAASGLHHSVWLQGEKRHAGAGAARRTNCERVFPTCRTHSRAAASNS